MYVAPHHAYLYLAPSYYTEDTVTEDDDSGTVTDDNGEDVDNFEPINDTDGFKPESSKTMILLGGVMAAMGLLY